MTYRFADLVQSCAETLTPSERRMIAAVLAQPRQAALASVTELARQSGVHEATASRLARKLGFDGFPAFRASLQSEFLPTEETATRMQRAMRSAGEGGALATLAAAERSALDTMLANVSEAQVMQAAGWLMEARRIYIFGRGNAEALSLLMAKRFLRYGRDVNLLSGDARSLAEGVLGMVAGDVLLAYAFRRPPKAYAALVDHCRSIGARVIVISDTTGPMLIPAPDLMLSSPRSTDADSFQTLTVPMAISNAIVIAAGASEETQTLQKLETLGSLIKRFE